MKKVETVVTYWVLWQGMHHSYERRLDGVKEPEEIAALAKPEVVAFRFLVEENESLEAKGKEFKSTTALEKSPMYYLGGQKVDGKNEITTRHGSCWVFPEGSIILPGF